MDHGGPSQRRSGSPWIRSGPADSFSRFGLSSQSAVELSGVLGEWLGRTVSPTLLYDYPTVGELAAHLAGGNGAGLRGAGGSGPTQALTPQARGTAEPIAVVGMACRFPMADGLDAYWRLLVEGGDAIRSVPESRWDADALYAGGGQSVGLGQAATRSGGFVDGHRPVRRVALRGDPARSGADRPPTEDLAGDGLDVTGARRD